MSKYNRNIRTKKYSDEYKATEINKGKILNVKKRLCVKPINGFTHIN